MRKKYISEIIKQFAKNRYARGTEKKVQRWIIDENNESEKNQELYNLWQSIDLKADPTTMASLDAVNKKLNLAIYPPKRRYLRRAVAVLIPVMIMAGFTLYYLGSRTEVVCISAAYGETKKITLPDQSVVWINSGSRVEYPKKFAKSDRTVRLQGEAYFSVEKDPARQFVVLAENMIVTVLGTEFRVTAYPEDISFTTLVINGKVQVDLPAHKEYILTASQQLVYNKGNGEILFTSENESETALKDGSLIFEKKTWMEIEKILERTFHVQFESNPSLLFDSTLYTVKFVNGEKLDQILDILGDIIGFTTIMDGKHIQINENR